MISYRPGTWFGIVGEHATVLLPPSEKARAGALWALIDDGAGFDEVLDALVSDGLRALPGFVLLAADETTTRVVVRGPSKAAFVTTAGEVVVEGSTSATWVEQSLTGVTGMSVTLEDVDEPLLTLHGGLVRLAALVSPAQVQTVQAPAPVAPVASSAAPLSLTPETEGAAEPSGPYAAVLPFPAGGPTVPPPVGLAGESSATGGPIDEAADEAIDEPIDEPVEEVVAEPEATEEELDVPAWLSSDSDPLSGPVDDEAWADEPTGVIPVVPAEEPAADQSPAAEPSAEPPAWTPSAPVVPGAVPPPPPFPPAPPLPPVPPVPPAPPSWGEPGTEPETETVAEQGAPQDDHDGLTRAGAPDTSLLPPPPGIAGQPPAPQVSAYAVAKLEFSHGERVDVDRVVIIGRAPEAGRFSLAEQPLLVTVPSPHQEISSTHIEVRPGTGVDHGAAVVTDLGSTNGTVVVQPGLGPEELRPGVPVQLMPGALIDLGDGLTIRVSQP